MVQGKCIVGPREFRYPSCRPGGSMEAIEQLLARHPFFEGLAPEGIRFLAGCGQNVQFRAGKLIFREGEAADEFYIIREGLVRIELASPRLGPVAIQTIHPGGVLGWSWLFPPYRWHFDALAVEPTRATV